MKVLSIKFNIDSKRYFVCFYNETLMEETFCYQVNSKTARKMISDFCLQKQNSKLKNKPENFIVWQ